MAITDTSAEAMAVYIAAFADADGEARVRRSVEMAEQAKVIALAGIRSRHPAFTEAEVARAWLEVLHGPALLAALDDAV